MQARCRCFCFRGYRRQGGQSRLRIGPVVQPGCDNNDIAHVSAEAAAAFKGSPSIPTYVIGVGPSLSNLNQIASAGGTKSAFMVSVADPSKTSTVFQQALDQIRGQCVRIDSLGECGCQDQPGFPERRRRLAGRTAS